MTGYGNGDMSVDMVVSLFHSTSHVSVLMQHYSNYRVVESGSLVSYD